MDAWGCQGKLKNRLLCQYIALIFSRHAAAALAALVLVPAIAVSAKTVYWGPKEKTVTIDPGHGGAREGARSTDGQLEKDLTLQLSRLIAEVMTKRYRSVLTRDGDYDIEIERRTAVANHEKSDALISVHLGGSFLHQVSGIHIYYFKPTETPQSVATVEDTDELASATSWDRIQEKHLSSSRLLAQVLCRQLQAIAPSIRCSVSAAPLLVLRGADMPAVLLEAGHLTNADDRRALLEDGRMEATARAIAEGVEAFFETLSKSD
jgi:N-acetylmuramoyl-L-alanine amidase